MIDRKKIKDKIENYEFNNNGVNHINGAYVDVRNVRIHKKEKLVTADIIIVRQMDGTSQRFNNCEYPFKLLGVEE